MSRAFGRAVRNLVGPDKALLSTFGMKNNVIQFARILSVILVLVVATTACNRRPRWGTALPGQNTRPGDDGRQQGIGQRGQTDNIPPINPFGGPGNGSVTPITPAPEGGIPSDIGGGSRSKFDDTTPDASFFATQTVYFDFDKAVVKTTEIEKIRSVAAHLKSNATHLLEVDGHCDERGTEEYNRALGERRAQAIREVLAREGVGPERVRTVSFGEDKPVDPGHSESAWSKNRRGEFILLRPNK